MESKNIIQAWASDLREVLGNEPLIIDDVRVGVFVSCDWSETRISEIVSILREETFK